MDNEYISFRRSPEFNAHEILDVDIIIFDIIFDRKRIILIIWKNEKFKKYMKNEGFKKFRKFTFINI